MKHPLAVAVGEGWTAAVSLAIQEGHISMEAAEFIARSAAVAMGEYLKGNVIYGKNLESQAYTGEIYETYLTKAKINLQKFGDV